MGMFMGELLVSGSGRVPFFCGIRKIVCLGKIGGPQPEIVLVEM